MLEKEFSLNEFDRMIEYILNCIMQFLKVTLRKFWKKFQLAVSFVVSLPKCPHGLRVPSTFSECQLSMVAYVVTFESPWERKAICFRNSGNGDIVELQNSLLMRWEGDYILKPVHHYKLPILLFFLMYIFGRQ